jgi:hypothetical protein
LGREGSHFCHIAAQPIQNDRYQIATIVLKQTLWYERAIEWIKKNKNPTEQIVSKL